MLLSRPVRLLASLLVSAALVLALAVPIADARVRRGTPFKDVLTGTPLSDRIFGLDGDDQIDGKKGRDFIRAGGGSDRVTGGPGDDRIYGDDGIDALVGDEGRDKIYGGLGADRITGGEDVDKIFAIQTQPDPDIIRCGDGRFDFVVADEEDRVSMDCERVRGNPIRIP